MKKYTRSVNAVFNVGYHVTLTPKYRRPFLWKFNIKLLERLFHIAAIKARGMIENIEIMPDHVHIFIRMRHTHIPISKMIQYLKGYTSFEIRRRCQWAQQYKAFWSAGYFIESVGSMSEHIIKRYIENQRTNIKPTYKHKAEVHNSLKPALFSEYEEKERTSGQQSDSMYSESNQIWKGFSKKRGGFKTDVP